MKWTPRSCDVEFSYKTWGRNLVTVSLLFVSILNSQFFWLDPMAGTHHLPHFAYQERLKTEAEFCFVLPQLHSRIEILRRGVECHMAPPTHFISTASSSSPRFCWSTFVLVFDSQWSLVSSLFCPNVIFSLISVVIFCMHLLHQTQTQRQILNRRKETWKSNWEARKKKIKKLDTILNIKKLYILYCEDLIFHDVMDS